MNEPKSDAVVHPALPASGSALRDLTTGSAGTLVLLLLVFVCYAWSTQSGYIWDDDAYVQFNPTLRSFNGLSRIWTDIGATPQYYPMTFTSFWLETQLFGLKPSVFHTVNALLHAGSVLMLWKILRRLSVPGAWVAAAVFAVHPINVESVAWISERKNTLSLLFGLSAAWMYLRYAKIGVDTNAAPAGEGLNVALPDDPKRLYRLFLALFVLALLSKTAIAVLPLMLAATVWWKRGTLTKLDLLSLLPAVVLGGIGGAVTGYLEHSPDFVGATGLEWQLSVVDRVLLVGQTAAFYAYKIVWPFAFKHFGDVNNTSIPFFPISFNYEKWTLNPASSLQWLPLVGVLATLGVLAAGVKRLGRGPLTAVLVFLFGLLPVSGLVTFFPQRFSWVADHFAYFGAIGLIAGVVAGLTLLLRRLPDVALAVIAVPLLAGMVQMSLWHASAFKNLETLWERTLRQNPRSWLAAVSFGVTLMDKANASYNYEMNRGNAADAVAFRDKLRSYAEQWIKEGLRLNPDGYEGYRSLGSLTAQRGDLEGAIALYRQSQDAAERMQAVGYRWPAFYIADLLIAQGKTEEGLAIFKELEQLETRVGKRSGNLFAQIRTKHGDVLLRRIKGKVQPDGMSDEDRAALSDAISQYDQATLIAPDYVPPKLKLARLLNDIGQPTEAFTQIQDVLRVEPNNLDAMLITAQIAASQNYYEPAAAQLVKLLSIQPRYLPAHLELARVLKLAGRTNEAIDELNRTLAIFPDHPDAKAMLASLTGQAATRPSSQPATGPATAPATGPATAPATAPAN